MPSQEQLKAWAESYLTGTISERDKAALEAWYCALPEAEVNWDDPNIHSANALRSKVYEAIDRQIREEDERSHRIYWRSVAAAAAVIACIASGVFYIRERNHTSKPAVAAAGVSKDIQPGSTKATLTLADGKTISLNDSGLLNVTAQNGAVCVLDRDGKLAYLGARPSASLINTLVTHKGEQSPPIALPDGTKVWLNAASTLQFPVIFAGNDRQVSLSGEAYFEVAKNAEHPFIVRMGENRIEVLGTSFDAMSYDDEPYKLVTLLEGAVRVGSAYHTMRLSPGQQSRTNSKGDIRVGQVDASQAIAWMSGQLPLNSMDTKSLLRQIGRWYDVNVVCEGEPPLLSFSGSLDRTVPLSELLSALNANGIHCTLKDRTVILKGAPHISH